MYMLAILALYCVLWNHVSGYHSTVALQCLMHIALTLANLTTIVQAYYLGRYEVLPHILWYTVQSPTP